MKPATAMDPATTARKIGVQLFRLQLANADIGREIQNLQVELESIDFADLAAPITRKQRRRRVKVSLSVVEYRAGLLSTWQRYKKAEAMRAGWEPGDKESWSIEALGDTHRKRFHVRRVYDWLNGELDVPAKSSPALAIENVLKEDIGAIKAAGIDPDTVF